LASGDMVVYVAILLFSNGEKVGRIILGVTVPDKFLYTGLGFVFAFDYIFIRNDIKTDESRENIIKDSLYRNIFWARRNNDHR